MAEMALNSAVLADFRARILPRVSRARFGGSRPAVLPECSDYDRRPVSKTLDWRTTGCPLNIPGKAQETVFINCVRKLVFRLNAVRGFTERIGWLAERGSGLKRPGAPVSFHVPLRKTTPITSTDIIPQNPFRPTAA